MENARVKNFFLIPRVKRIEFETGTINLPDGADVPVTTSVDGGMGTGERYSIEVSADGVRLSAGSEEGLFRARTTFEQLRMNMPREMPCLKIVDWPDFETRGFYHDVTRGRVPTLDTLKQLADTLAFYKINQLQLYVEHSFAFEKIPELWEGKTPLTADDIRELDRYCADRYIDLVPSLSTFGHLYELLRLPRFEHLNELDIKASETERCLWDRMAHYTLDACNPESFELVRGMIEEYAPLFSSRYFNICCDETFDLGKGKNAARAGKDGAGIGRLYVDFVKKVMDAVRSAGKTPMLWGDIVLKHPDLISELSTGDDGVIFLNWDYTPEVDDTPVMTFKNAGVTQYVCPGVNGWSRFAADIDRACENISRMTRFGKDADATGVLNTDWGDCGQVNLLATSYHGLAFGAAKSWDVEDCNNINNIDRGELCPPAVVDNINNINDNIAPPIKYCVMSPPNLHAGVMFRRQHDATLNWRVNNNANDDFDMRFAFLQWGIDDSGRLGKLLRELGALSGYHFGNLYAWINGKQCLWFKEDDVNAMDPSELTDKIFRAGEIRSELRAISAKIADEKRKAEFDEYIFAAFATEWLLLVLMKKKKHEYRQDFIDLTISLEKVIYDGRALIERFKSLWRARNRESELRDVVDTVEAVIKRLETWGSKAR